MEIVGIRLIDKSYVSPHFPYNIRHVCATLSACINKCIKHLHMYRFCSILILCNAQQIHIICKLRLRIQQTIVRLKNLIINSVQNRCCCIHWIFALCTNEISSHKLLNNHKLTCIHLSTPAILCYTSSSGNEIQHICNKCFFFLARGCLGKTLYIVFQCSCCIHLHQWMKTGNIPHRPYIRKCLNLFWNLDIVLLHCIIILCFKIEFAEFPSTSIRICHNYNASSVLHTRLQWNRYDSGFFKRY